MAYFDPTLLILLVLAGLGIISHNMTVTLAILVLLAILIGVVVSWLGGRGVSLMSNQPSVVAGLLVGTVMGVALFRGVPVGPLIAAGLLSLLIGKT